MTDNLVTQKRPYYGVTTPQQRILLFETYEETGNVTHACRVAHVGRSTFYYWKPRFLEGGYQALQETASHKPHTCPTQVPAAVAEKVIRAKRAHPEWGRVRIAQELAKGNNWIALVSPSSVRRILQKTNLLPPHPPPPPPKKAAPVVRHAEKPGETANVDLCFIPTTHEPAVALPAVSGSSGRLTVSSVSDEDETPTFPGQAFAQTELSYTEAMDAFIAARQAQTEGQSPSTEHAELSLKAQRQKLRQEEEALRATRRKERQQRQAQDEAWRQVRKAHRDHVVHREGLSSAERKEQRAVHQGVQARWKAARANRHVETERRKAADRTWREHRLNLRQQLSQLPLVTAWIAVLVIVDNCTRQSLGLPIFVMGAHVTAAQVVEALTVLLPNQLHYLIADAGVHFTADVMKELAHARGFVRVPLARHRPCSNGIAERFVLTLKQWLTDKTWQTAKQLRGLLNRFRKEYNARPHQGVELAGLSPDEYARRLESV